MPRVLSGLFFCLAMNVFAAIEGWSTPLPELSSPRNRYSATLLHSGSVLIAGGCRAVTSLGDCSPTTSTEIYDPATGQSLPGPDMVHTHNFSESNLLSRASLVTVTLDDGKVLLIDANPEIYDPVANTFTETAPRLPGVQWPFLYATTATLLKNGKVLVLSAAGSSSPPGTYVPLLPGQTSAQTYDPATNQWTSIPPPPGAGHGLVVLPSGKVLVVGGYGCISIGIPDCGLSDVWLYDPQTGDMEARASMPYKSIFPSVAVLPNGTILTIGGYSVVLCDIPRRRCSDAGGSPPQLYDVAADRWSLAKREPIGLGELAKPFVLPTGEVLAVDADPQGDDNYFYDPPTNTWSLAAGSLAFQTATLLPSGLVLMIGTSAVELYDPYGPPPLTPPTVTVVEYYNASFDHYFISWLNDEIFRLDNGSLPGWVRTGQTFKASDVAIPALGTSPVCRFYIPPASGDSHFFGRDALECNSTAQKFAALVLEDPRFMHMLLPAAGTCPYNTTPVYRVFSNRADANHRYTTDRATRDQMVAKGWIAEGDGPDLVVMCAPQ